MRFGPGLWPGPRRQARWADRGLRRSRSDPEDRFREAVRKRSSGALPLPRERAKASYAPAEVAGCLAMADAQPTAERRMQASRQRRY